jgi:hypothetical protein
MNSKSTILFAFAMVVFAAFASTPLAAQTDSMTPDTVIMKDGRRYKGLIVHNTSDTVTIQTPFAEVTVSKSDVTRIQDESDESIYFTAMQRRGSLPPWRVIVNDLRLHDKIKSFEQIPATVIDSGEFRNIPYQSFRINKDVELNIYGDPEDPSAVEVGVYGPRKNYRQLHTMLRQYLAGYLTSRDELQALYSICTDTGGSAKAGSMLLSITPPDDPESFDAWWVGISNPRELDAIRLSDAEYARIVRPVNEVFDKEGNLLTMTQWKQEDANLSRRLSKMGDNAQVFLRGFYRDENGRFQLLPDSSSVSE